MILKMEHFLRIILMGIVGVIGVLAIAHLLLKLPFPTGREPEWVGAIGTVLTLAGTIWLATTETRRREQDDLQRARLQAANLLHRLNDARNILSSIKTKAFGMMLVNDSWPIFQDQLEAFRTIRPWSLTEIEALVPLPNNTAALLAQSEDEISSLRGKYERLANIYGDDFAPEMQTLGVECHNILQRTTANLEVCINTCVEARNLLHRSGQQASIS